MMKLRKPTHPGVVFREDVLDPLNISVTEAADRLNVSRKALSEVLNERSALSPEMALKWAAFTNTTPESWYQMQVKLFMWEVRHSHAADMVKPLSLSSDT